MTRASRLACTAALALASARSPHAQVPPAQVIAPVSQPSSPADSVADLLGRDTPRRTIRGFSQAVAREDMVSAIRYLELNDSQRPHAETLVRQLSELMDRYFTGLIIDINDAPEGALDDGLALSRERAATIATGRGTLDVRLVRVQQPAGQVWLISSDTLAQVPSAHRSMEATPFESVLPERFVRSTILGVPAARWIAWTASIVVPLVALWLLFTLVGRQLSTRTQDPARRARFESWLGGLRWPLIVVATLVVHIFAVRFLGFSLRFRFLYAKVALVAVVVLLAWLAWRFTALSFEHARVMALRRGESGVRSLLMLGERLVKAGIALAAIFTLLTIAGVDTTTALAGVGIGGVAVALGAQKSVENLLGGVFLLTDKALAVGDTCTIAGRLGVIEDITLRSVQLRTQEQTLMSVPAGVLSQESVENFATRHKILVQGTLRLRYGTSPNQLRQILVKIRGLIAANRELEQHSSRVRLVDFGLRAIEIELFVYVLTPDYLRFMAVREALLLDAAGVVEAEGSGFAQPTQFIYQEQARRASASDAAARARAEHTGTEA